ncbi:BTAD domain-containing putative transcriptional regulator [Micromonospora sp. NPDC049679]|uniref:AfsR/SARP family transcriptional regulator n=1 Tax=Micromonospora sp. NPDC049679 TaxID=3155920 RepID=UPI0033D45221
MTDDRRPKLHLLGGFRLTAGDRELCVPGTGQRLLAILAVRGHMNRLRVAGSLWPDRLESRALASLRTAVWRMQAQVGDVSYPLLRCTGSELSLTDDVVVDLHELRRQVQGGSTSLLPPVVFRPWVGHSELLPGWDDEWLLVERERVRQMRLHALEQLATRLARQAEFGPALDAALTCMSIDPLRESAHRTLIRIHVEEGNLSEARRAYEACRKLLWEQLGVAPTSETRSLLSVAAERAPRAGRAPEPLARATLTAAR